MLRTACLYSSKTHVLSPQAPMGWSEEAGPLGGDFHEGGALMHDISALISRDTGEPSSLSALHHVRTQ